VSAETEPPSTRLPRQIGTVEILTRRIYHLDSAMAHEPNATTVVVEPGRYKLYRNGISIYWLMAGRINTGRVRRLGDGMLSMMPNDEAGGPLVRFPSRTFGPDEWDKFRLTDPTAQDGHPDQRLKISMLVNARSGDD